MSSQAFSRADRNRAARGSMPRRFFGRPLPRAVADEEMVDVCTEVDAAGGTVTYEYMTREKYARLYLPALGSAEERKAAGGV